MDIHQLKVFKSVFENKSFTKASQRLNITQSTISAHIRTLEEEFNCRLFDRLGRTIIPTKEAEVLYTKAIEIIEKADEIKEAMGRYKKEITGKLIVGASTIPGTYLLPLIMTAFQKKFPSVSFQIHISDSKEIIEMVTKFELLIGIVGAKLGNKELDYTPFIEDELIVVSSPSLIRKGEINVKDLTKVPMVLREEGSGTLKIVEQILGEKGIHRNNINIAGIFGSTDAVKQAVKAGLGVSVLSKVSVADELKYRKLKAVKIKGVPMKRKFYIITHKKRTLPYVYTVFFNHLIEESKIHF